MTDDMTMPTRSEYDRRVRRIWKVCISLSVIFCLTMGGIVASMLATGYDAKSIVNVLLIVVYVVVPLYGVGYMGPAFATSLVMGQRGLEIGERTSETMQEFSRDVKPILKDAREVIGEVKKLVEQFESQNPKAVVEFIEKLAKDGTVDRIVKSIDIVARKFGEGISPRGHAEGATKEALLGSQEGERIPGTSL